MTLHAAGQWLLGYLSPATCNVPCQVGSRRFAGRDFPDPNLSTLGHVLMICLWYGLILAYGALVTYQWAIQPDAEVLTQVDSSGFDPVELFVQAQCTNDPNCGTLNITVNYDPSSACGYLSRPSSLIPPAGQWVTLCFTQSAVLTTLTTGPLAVFGITVDFSKINPGFNATDTFPSLKAQGIVRIYGSTSEGITSLIRVVNLASWQVKTLLIGQSIRVKNNVVTSSSAYASATQYEGKRPNWRSTLVFALSPYVNLVTVQTQGPQFTVWSIFSLVAGWLGIVWVLKALFPYTKPYFVKFFPRAKS